MVSSRGITLNCLSKKVGPNSCVYFLELFAFLEISIILYFSMVINPFHATGLFRYPLSIERDRIKRSYFQGVSKETSGMKWVNKDDPFLQQVFLTT